MKFILKRPKTVILIAYGANIAIYCATTIQPCTYKTFYKKKVRKRNDHGQNKYKYFGICRQWRRGFHDDEIQEKDGLIVNHKIRYGAFKWQFLFNQHNRIWVGLFTTTETNQGTLFQFTQFPFFFFFLHRWQILVFGDFYCFLWENTFFSFFLSLVIFIVHLHENCKL